MPKLYKEIVFLFPILFTTVSAQDPLHRVSYRDFTCGLNDTVPSHYLEKSCSPNAKNWLIDEIPGALVKRRGFDESWRLPSGNIPRSTCRLLRNNGTEFLYINDGPNLYQVTDFTTHTLITSSLNTTAKLNCRIIDDEAWFSNGSDAVFKVNGTSITTTFDGTGSTPNIPKGKFILYEKNRVYTIRTSGSPSSVFYSVNFSTVNGNPIRPDSTNAWLSTSEVFCGKDDGSPIYGAVEMNGVPYIFKETSIWKVVDIDDYRVGCVRVINGVGSRCSDCVTVIDGVAKFWGTDNIYEFNGETVRPIGDAIRSGEFKKVIQPRINSDAKTWTSAGDFSASGTTLTRISTTIVDGSMVVARQTIDDFSDGDYTSNPVWTVRENAGSVSVVSNKLQLFDNSALDQETLVSADSTWTGGDFRVKITISATSGGCAFYPLMSTSGDNSGEPTGDGYGLTISNYTGAGDASTRRGFWRWTGGSGTLILSLSKTFNSGQEYEILIKRKSDGSWKVYIDNVLEGTVTDNTYSTANSILVQAHGDSAVNQTCKFDDLQINLTSATWISEDINSTTDNSGWGNFDVTQDKNTGAIDWSLKTSNSASGLNGVPFKDVTPGIQVSTDSASTFVKLQATITVTNDQIYESLYGPEIKLVQVGWQEGGDPLSLPYSAFWERRYIVSVSTTGNTTRKQVYYYTRAPYTGWMPFTGIQSNGFEVFGNSLYSIDSSTNRVVKIFGETNDDDGNNIDAVWESRDETLDFLDRDLKIFESYVDYSDNQGSSFDVSYSTTMGSTFNDKTVTISGGAARGTKRLFWGNPTPAKQIRSRIRDNSQNAPTKVYGLDVYAEPSRLTSR